jgi:hypothetical protein
MVASAVRDALHGARAGVAQLRDVAAAAAQDAALKEDVAALEQQAAALLHDLEQKVSTNLGLAPTWTGRFKCSTRKPKPHHC